MHFPKIIEASLNYCPADFTATRDVVLGTVGAYRRPIDTRPTSIQDVRGQEGTFTLDVHGFQFLHHVSPYVAFFDETVAKNGMYQEAAEILKQA